MAICHPKSENDALYRCFSSGVSDLAENHDAYLAEAYGDYEPRDDLS